MLTRNEALDFLIETPYLVGRYIGFDKLTPLHNGWIQEMVFGTEDGTLQAHRGSYKTTCISIALPIIMLLYPNDKTMFQRKTDADIKEIISQVKKVLQSSIMQTLCVAIWGVELKLTTDAADQINTNLAATDPRGTPQLMGMGTKGSMTGKHFDRVFTDDIVNVQDRISKAERERTKIVYQELQNIKNRDGRIFNTGTPWHKEDAFTLMPNPKVFDCYSTGLISPEELEAIKAKMTHSLFAANYEMKHVASDDVIFRNPVTGGDPAMCEQGESQIDAAYDGEDYTAFCVVRKKAGKYYVFGKLWRKHVDDVEDIIVGYHNQFMCGKNWNEDNADKGYLQKSLKMKGVNSIRYHESQNKFVKICTYLKDEWGNVIFVEGTDQAFIDQICEFNIDAEHDDAPDCLASAIRRLWTKNERPKDESVLRFL